MKKVRNLAVVSLCIHGELGDIVSEVVPGHPVDQVRVVVYHAGRFDPCGLRLDLLPCPCQKLDVPDYFLFGLLFGDCPDYEPHAPGLYLVGQIPQPVSYRILGDLPADTHVINRRYENYVPAGQRNVRYHSCALCADRLLGDLHQDFLAGFEKLLDAFSARLGKLDLIAVSSGLDYIRQACRRVVHIQECVLLQADVHEGGLHARKDVLHLSLVDVAQHRRVPAPVEE